MLYTANNRRHRVLDLHMADGDRTPLLHLSVSQAMPFVSVTDRMPEEELELVEKEINTICERDAARLYEALIESLPSGTVVYLTKLLVRGAGRWR